MQYSRFTNYFADCVLHILFVVAPLRGTRSSGNQSENRNGLLTHLNQEDFYKMESEPRGYCMIINNQFNEAPKTSRGDELPKRNGTDKDKNALTKLFTWLKFKVESFDNVSGKYMETVLELHANDEKNNEYDCFVCCILSHGYEKGIYCNDGTEMDFKDIKKFFDGERCRELIGKPKLFFVQACQGEGKCGWAQLERDSPLIPSAAAANNNPPVPDELGEIDYEDMKKNEPEVSILSSDADFLFYVASTPGKGLIKYKAG